MNTLKKNYQHQAGFTLIELMISVTLGLLLIAMVVSVFVNSNRNYVQDDNYAIMQENGRFALKRLTHELAMVQYWGGMLNPGAGDIDTTTLPATTDCGLTYNPANPVIIINQATATDIAAYPCIETTGFVTGSDVLIVKRASGQEATDQTPSGNQVSMVVNTTYLITNTNGKSGRLVVYDGTAATAPTAGAENAWQFYTRIYYVRNKNGEPVLYMSKLLTDGSMDMSDPGLAETNVKYPTEVVEGVENFQVDIGLDTNEDGIPDQFTNTPTAAEMLTAVTARVHILARSTDQVPGYVNEKVYDIGLNGGATIDYSGANSDSYYRRIYTETILLRNTAYLRAID